MMSQRDMGSVVMFPEENRVSHSPTSAAVFRKSLS